MATTTESSGLQRGQLGLFGVIMPGVAQVAPAFNLFFTTGLMVSLAGASAPLIFLISMGGMGATATTLVRGGHDGLSATPFSWPSGHSTDVLLTFSLAVLAFGGFEAAAPLAEE